MHSLLLFDTAEQTISPDLIEQAFRSIPGFQDVRRSAPPNYSIAAQYVEQDDFTTVVLNSEQKVISIRGTSGAALSAAWLLHTHLANSLRMIDTDYSFDLFLSDYPDFASLQADIEKTRN